MKIPTLTALLTLLSVTNASSLNARHHHLAQKRQLLASPSGSSTATSSTGATTSTSASLPVGGATTSSSSSPPAPTGPPPLDPGTGVPPLSSISVGMATQAPLPVSSTYAAGATPPISGAPSLPTPFVFRAGDWPAQDITPPTDSEEVQEWMKELDGFDIPNISPTVDGTCVNDTTAASEAAQRGWWSCGGHTRDTDIVACPDKMVWGLSFDDGPSPHTQKLLNYLDQNNLRATFFVVGSRVIERYSVLVEEYMAGHEIGVHTWSHRHLTSLSTESVVAELGWTRKAIQTVLGVTPTIMRPPYGDIDDRVRAISLAMGLTPIIWTTGPSGPFDTFDWKVAGNLVPAADSVTNFQGILNTATTLSTGFIVLEHDLFEITVDLAVGYTINAALTHNPPFNIEPIGTCSKMPATDLYLETTTNSTFPFRNHTMDISGTAGTAGISNSSHGTNGSAAGRAGTNGSSSQGGAVGRMAPLVSGIIVMVLAALSGFLL